MCVKFFSKYSEILIPSLCYLIYVDIHIFAYIKNKNKMKNKLL